MRRKTTIAAVTVLILSVAIIAAFLITDADSGNYPILGTDMLADISVVENHREALKVWADKGITDAVLINIDAHDDLRMVPPDEMKKLKELHKRVKQGKAGAMPVQEGYGPVTNANFIHAAAKLGIVKKVVWVVPGSYALFSDNGERLRTLLRMYGFTDRAIAGFSRTKGCFTGKTDGIPLVICDAGSLPDLAEPVLLSVDVDFFPAEITGENHRITEPLKKTVRALFAKKYRVRNAVVAHSVNGGFTEASCRWVGELAVDSIRIPGVMRLAELPDRYAFLQKADHLHTFKKHRELLEILSPLTAQGIDDPAVLIYAAIAAQGVGRTDDALTWAEQACRSDKGYCYGLTQVGSLVLERNGLAKAEPFFAKGYELAPGMDEGQFRLAMALKKSGRYDEAIRYFNVFRNSYGPFPVDFYLAETLLLKGDDRGALHYYDSGRKELARNPAVLAGFGDFRAIEGAAVFYERKGDSRIALELRESIRSKVD